jgi:hypothetical protein
MNVKLLAVPALALALGGCRLPLENEAKPASPDWVGVPALPIIQDAVRELLPTFNGRRVPVLVNQLCALAQGQITQPQSDAQLQRLGLNAASLPRTGEDALPLLVNGDRAGQAAACAAAQAVAALTPLNPQEIMKPVPAAAGEKVDKVGKNSKEPKVELQAGAGQQQQWAVDYDVASRLFSVRVAQARANAETFALIANRLAAMPGLSEQEYREQARALFREMAPTYLRRVQQQMPVKDARYQISHLDDKQLSFTSDYGVRYEVSATDGLTLKQYGQLWYGRGLLLGSNYRLQVSLLR